MELAFDAVAESQPGPKWREAFRRAWPGWRAWYLGRGGEPRLGEGERRLRRHMPELAPTWERQVELAGGDEVAARFLTFWNPPAYLVHCSQAVLLGHESGPLLVRNYDLDPMLSEATLLCSAWSGRRVIAAMEGIAGAADGVNEAGLAVSLAFGGRSVTGPGFGVPLIVRYLLEVCDRTADAVEVLRRVPSHMSYNVTVLDRAGAHATVFLAPDRPAEVTCAPAATNHQARVEWPEQARFSRTVERLRHLERLLAKPGPTPERLTAAFLRPPLFSADHGWGFGTVYTAAYRPLDASCTLHWPGAAPWRQSCGAFREGRRAVGYPAPVAPPAGFTAQVRWALAGAAVPAGFVAALDACLRRPQDADWRRLAAAWAEPG